MKLADRLDFAIMEAIDKFHKKNLGLTAADVREAFERLDVTMTRAEAAKANMPIRLTPIKERK
jgi:hypothetical protein